MLTLLLGRAGSGRTAQLIERACAAGAERPQVLVVPEHESHEMERRLCRQGGAGTALFAEVLPLSRMADRVAAEAGGLATPVLDSGGRMLVMYRAIQSVAHSLKVYGKPGRKPSFLAGMLSTLDELKLCRVSPEDLARAGGDQGGTQGDRFQDLAMICSAYDSLLRGSAMDPRDLLDRLADQLDECGWGTGFDFLVDGYERFYPQEEEILRRLLRRAHSVTVALLCDHLEEDEDGAGVFSAARRTAARLLQFAGQDGVEARVEVLPAPVRDCAPLAHLEENLFRDGAAGVPSGGAVTLFAAAAPRGEVEWTAAKIRELLRTGGYRLRDIAVTARDMGEYDHLLETVFRRYDLPVYLARKHDILDRPVMTLVVAALETASRGYEYDSLFRYLKTGLTGLPEEDRDLLENYVLKWEIRQGGWTGADWKRHPDGYGAKFEPKDLDLLARLNQARRQVIAPLERLRKNGDHTGAGQVRALYRFLEELGLAEQLEARTAQLREDGELTLAEEYAQLWEILCGALEQCARLLGDTPLELEEFSRLFQLVLSQYDVGTIPVSLDRVTAGEMTRVVNREVKALFLLGAHDGAIPARPSGNSLLTDEDRALLEDYGLRMAPREEEQLYRELTVVYESCAQPSRKLLVTWPAAGSDGGERRPSFLISRLERLFPDLTVERESALNGAFRLAAPGAAAEQAGRDPQVRDLLAGLPGQKTLLDRLERAEHQERGHLSPDAVAKLYGSRIPMSASRLDKYKSCHFSYFMKFGLKAEPRKPAGFQAPEYGTFVHAVLEHVLRQAGQEGGAGALTEQRRRALTQEAVDRYVADELGGLDSQTPRFRYLFQRLLRTVDQVVAQVVEELSVSSFQPLSFELGFTGQGPLPPVEFRASGMAVAITGYVDRVDGWLHNGKLYLRVVDYKTGRKSFDLTEIWNGMGLQMLLYLFTLQDRGEAYYGHPVEPAGVLYLPAREALVSADGHLSDDALRKETDRQLRRRGLILNDPEVLRAMERDTGDGIRFLPVKMTKDGPAGDSLVTAEQLAKLRLHTERILAQVCQEMAEGRITADPFWRGDQKNACLFCDYYEACHFEEGRGGDVRRWLPGVKGKDFWARLDAKGGKQP